MGRPPCCDKDGIKKGPWTPEEDIMLASYVQDHGPGNWRSVPKNTGLLRCSKSCRLRWTNYLRPGIKRGNFTEHEEKMIISLQSFLGNKWAAIAAYLPQRTDNDIKNYWNTHLKKKLKKLQLGFHNPNLTSYNASSAVFQFLNKSRRKNFDMIQYKISTPSSMSILPKLNKSFSSTSTYASSTENISRLLQGWIKSSPKASSTNHEIRSEQKAHDGEDDGGDSDDEKMNHTENSCSNSTSSNISFDEKKGEDFFLNTTHPSKRNHQILDKVEDVEEICDHFMSQEELESLLTLENTSNIAWEKTSSDSNGSEINQSSTTTTTTTSIINEKNDSILDGLDHDQQELMELIQQPTTFSFLEKWLFDEITGEPLF